jgi:fucose permease
MEQTHHGAASTRWTLVIACGIFLASGVVLAGLGPVLPFLAARVGREVATLGGIFTALSAGIVLSQFGIGPASDRFGQRAVLVASMGLMAAGTLSVTLGETLAVLLAGALLAGAGFGGVLAAGNGLIARLFAARSAAALNLVNLFFGVGSMLGPAISGLAGARLGAPQAALWVGAGLLVALAPVMLARGAAPAPARASHHGAADGAARPLVLWLIGLLLLVYVGTEVTFGGWVTVYMTSSADLTPTAATLITSGFWLALTSGRALGALLGLRLTPGRLLATSLIGVLAGATLLAAGLGDPAQSIAAVLLLGLSFGPVFPTVLSIVTTATRGSNRAASLVLALGNGGGLFLPALTGLLLGRYGPVAVPSVILAGAVSMLVFGAATALAGTAIPRAPAPRETPTEC